jgi:hypothetical protein
MITARVSLERTWLAETLTGAALILFVVKVAAATAGALEATSARSAEALLFSLMPQQVAEAVKPSGAVTPPKISEKPKDMFGRFDSFTAADVFCRENCKLKLLAPSGTLQRERRFESNALYCETVDRRSES